MAISIIQDCLEELKDRKKQKQIMKRIQDMKCFHRWAMVLLALVILMPTDTVMAQKNKKGKREVSPIIEGRQKVRKADYDTIWKFTAFDAKSKYYSPFDYTTLEAVIDERPENWGVMSPVINYLSTVSRAPMRMCAIFAINPKIDDDMYKKELTSQAQQEAIASYELFKEWSDSKKMRNKVQFQVAQVDYRYWMGTEYFNAPMPEEDIIHLGYVLYFGSKKINLFPSAAESAQKFKDVKFFPNDATITDSYQTYMDELATYLKENDRLEVLLCGYSDNTGTDAYNLGLSRQRAVEIKKALTRRGIEDFRIEIEAHGSDNPVGDNSTLSGRMANNRVTVTIQ